MTGDTIGFAVREESDLRRRLEELEQMAFAIRAGEVDAVVVEQIRNQVYVLNACDEPYRLMVEQMSQGALTLTCDGIVLHCNERFAAMLGRSCGALDGRAIYDFVPAGGRTALEALLKAAESGRSDAGIDFVIADGAPLHAHVSVRGVREGARGNCLLMTDLTEEKRYRELQQAQQELSDFTEHLRYADRRKNEFMAILAHELRNTLAPINYAVSYLKARQKLEPEMQWSVGIIERHMEMMARLLEDLLDISRMSRGRLELRKSVVELTALLKAAMDASRPLIEARGHTLVASLPAEPVFLEADSTRLSQIFVNLLNNAAKYTDKGGRISLSAELRGERVVVTVRDNGIGIAPDVLPKIFDIFIQAKTDATRPNGGLGIGLSLVRGLVELHDGRIEARSGGLGSGSEFVVELPLAGPKTS